MQQSVARSQDDLRAHGLIALGERMRHAAATVAAAPTDDDFSPGAFVSRIPNLGADLTIACEARTISHRFRSARYGNGSIVPGPFGVS